MKTKPMWGLWLLMIAAPVAVFFSVNHWKNLPPPIPPLDPSVTQAAAKGHKFIGEVQLYTEPNVKGYSAMEVFLCNPTRQGLFIKLVAAEGYDQLSQAPLLNVASKSAIRVKMGTTFFSGGIGNQFSRHFICYIKSERKKTVRLKMFWRHGKKRSIKYLVITPQMTPQN